MLFESEDALPTPGTNPLNGMEIKDLLDLRSRIDRALPALALKDMNLEEELVIQFLTAKELQTAVLSSNEEANKKAQTLNAVSAALQALIKMQTDFHTAERLKNIESKLIRALDKVPKHHLEEFFVWYESEAS
jgi:predicted nucleic acid-binding protein